MNNKFFPIAFKDKLKNILKYLYGIFFFFISIILALSLVSFNINDSSFLTSTSNQIRNFMGVPGSYVSSFLLYTFGVMAYLFVLFFITYSLKIFLNQIPRYFFIRLLIYVVSLILIPQIMIHMEVQFSFIENLIHLGNKGTRYEQSDDKNQSFLGGVFAVSKETFERCNGYPNNLMVVNNNLLFMTAQLGGYSNLFAYAVEDYEI